MIVLTAGRIFPNYFETDDGRTIENDPEPEPISPVLFTGNNENNLSLSVKETRNCAELKGYLCYKMITSQNESSEADLRTFLFCSKVMFCSQDIQVLAFLTMP